MNPAVNILLVDDEARNLDVLESVLQVGDYNLVRALTAEGALRLLLDGEFAAIVLDIQMPEMTGIELAHLIKQRKRTQHIPIIFLTAYFQEDKDVLEGYEIGAVDFLTKPINPQILRSKIAVFADLYRKTRALAASNATLEQEIGQRLKAEAELRNTNNELEARVQERTGDLQKANEDLRAREATLIAREAQLRLVTDHAPVFITQFDHDHRFKFVNRTFARRFGLEPRDLVGKHCTEVMGERAYQDIRRHLDAALEGSRVEFDAEISYASLGPRWVHVMHEPERTPEGKVVGLVAVTTDITERKRAEHDVVLARDRAVAASRAKDEFLAKLSHELRTPLNPVLLLSSDGASNAELPPAVRADFAMIAKNVELEARLIDDLLDLTRITQGKLVFAMRPVDLHVLLEEAVAMMQADLTEKELGLKIRLRAASPMVMGDDVRLKQILWNVLKNAVKFTPRGGAITVETAVAADPGRLTVQVTDSGIGMTAEEMGRIFEAFAQGDHARQHAHQFGGLGLGLVISRMLVEHHGGTIRATSAGRNQGTTVQIEIPSLATAGANGEALAGLPASPHNAGR